METGKKKRFHWGWGIATLYAGFVLFTLVIVGYASLQHFDLVDKDYYEKGIDYERQIERIKRAEALPEKPLLAFGRGQIMVQFPSSGQPGDYAGTITLFRPSAASLDITTPLALSADFTQRIMSERLAAGLWRVKLAWTAGGSEYYLEKEIRVE